MGRSLRLFFFSIAMMSLTFAKGQSFHVALFSEKDGLPPGRVNDVFEERSGFVWLAHHDGLLKYDGKKFVKVDPSVYRKFSGGKNGDFLALSDKKIVSLPSLLTLPTGDTGAEMLFDIKPADEEDSFWLLCDKGLFYYGDSKFQKIVLNEFEESYKGCLFNSDTNAIRLITPSGVIYQLDKNKKQLNGVKTISRFNGLQKYIHENDSEGYILDKSGVHQLISNDKIVEPQWLGLPEDFQVTNLLIHEKNILVTSATHGIWLGKKDVTHYRFTKVINGNEPHRPDELPFEEVYALSSHDNNIWVICSNGLGLLQKRPFHRISFDIPMASFEQAAFTERGVIYLGENGLFECVKTEGRISEYNCNTIDHQLRDGIQTAIAAHRDRLWIATSNSKILYIEDNKHSPFVDISTRGKNVFYMFADRAGNLWVSQAPTEKPIVGVLKITPDLKLVEYGRSKGFHNRMLSTKQSHTGTVYCVGIGEKTYLYQYDSVQDQFINISAEMHFDYGENFEVHTFGIGHDTTLWLGSTVGLLRYKGGEIEKIHFTELTDSEVIAVTVAMDGAVWFSTDNKGLVRYDPISKQYAIFDKHAGLSTNFLTYRALYQTKDGTISVGTREGFFLSSSIAHQWQKTQTPLLFHVSSESGASDGVYPYNSSLRFNFGSLTHPAKTVQYMYRLLGKEDPQWKMTNHDSLYLSNLQDGEYQLEIKAKEIGGYTWSEPLVYAFTVSEVWYKQSVAIISFIVLGGLAIAAGTRMYNRNLQREKRILERKVQQRTQEISSKNEEIERQRDNLLEQKEVIEEQNDLLRNAKTELEQKVKDRTAELSLSNKELMEHNVQLEQFAFMTAHNLRGPVARLLGLAAIFNTKDPSDPLNIEVLKRVQESTENLDEIIADMTRILDIKRGIHSALSKMNARFIFLKALNALSPEIDSRKIVIENRIHSSAEVLGMEPYVFSVFYNTISNSIKYSDVRKRPQIIAESIESADGVHIIIGDNGVGFDAMKLRHKLFKPYSRLNSNVEGKGLGLYLMKIEMESMGGNVDIQSTPEEGTIVTLTFKK